MNNLPLPQLVFQSGSTSFGLLHDGATTWYTSPTVGGESTTLLDAVLLPFGVILVTSRGVVTITESANSTLPLTVSQVTVQGKIQCPAVCSDRVLLTIT